jgi:hypothetical protein
MKNCCATRRDRNILAPPAFKNMRRMVASRGSNDRGLAPPPEAEPGTLIV